MKKTIIITGAAGFLGSNLVDRFLSEDYRVYGIDNLSTGRLENIIHIRNPDFIFLDSDVVNPIKVVGDIDYILHFASAASPPEYAKIPIETLMAGSIGTQNCLELAKQKGATFLMASTSEVYGDAIEHPQKETYFGSVNSIGERSCYDEAKRYAEAITMAYRRKHNVDTRIVRIFNTYGERMAINDGRAVPSFFEKAIRGVDVELYGSGKQTRSLSYVSDTVEGIFRLLLNKYPYPVNIGNPQEVTMEDLANEIIELTGSESKIIYKPLPQDDPKQRCPDISLANKLLDWQPKVSRKDGLKKTFEYFKRNKWQ